MSPAGELLLPLFLHFGLILGLYAALTWARMVTVRRGRVRNDDFSRADGDAPLSACIQHNLANQFEAPVFAWIGVLLLIMTGQVLWLDVVAAWVFLFGRLVHTVVQTTGDRVALRGQVFVINFLGVLWLMGHAAWAIYRLA